jgi:glycosyltransferase involved in cell wall biosynthesis
MNDVGVIALVPDRWHGIWMPRHQVLSRLARHFEVVWVEPPRPWRDYWLRFGSDDSESAAPQIPGFSYYHPGRWLPEVHQPRPLRDWLNRRRLARARRILERRGCTRIVLYLWRYEFAWAVEAGAADLTCYHIDDEYQFSTEERPNDAAEVALLKAVDLVIVHSPKLMEKKGGINPDTITVPNGVDFKAYSAPAAEPRDLAAIAHPRIGYVGVVKSQLDLDLLLDLSRRRPEWSFVLVGPQGHLGSKAAALEDLSRQPNVRLLGNRKLPDLPAYTQHMDVCIMCYEVNSYTDYIYPLKLHEYLATGQPIVSSPIQSVLRFSDTVRLARTAEEWEAAIAQSLAPGARSAEAIAGRRKVAAEHDWDLLVGRIADAFRTRLAAKSRAP